MQSFGRTALTVATVVAVVGVPLIGALWCAWHAMATLTGENRELLFVEVVVGVLTAALAVVFSWLTVSATAGSVAALAQLTLVGRSSHRRPLPPRRAAGASRRGASAAAAAVTALVLLAAGTQAASAVQLQRPSVLAAGAVTAVDAAESPQSPQSPHAPQAASTPAVVGGWTPRVSPLAPSTARLVLGTPDTTGDDATATPHVVLRGESLWTIAAAHLGPGATATEISTAWPRWWQANHDVIGDDPDLIQPGQHLRPPA